MTEPSDVGHEFSARLAEGDIAWIRHQFHVGELNDLRRHVSIDDWNEVPRRIDAGDLTWLRARFEGTPAGAAMSPAAQIVATAAVLPPPTTPEPAATIVDAASAPQITTTAAPATAAAPPTTKAVTTAATATTMTSETRPPAEEDRRIGGSWTWLIPLIAVLALVGVGIASCEGSSNNASRTSPVSSAVAAATTSPAVNTTKLAPTTVATPPSTTTAPTTAPPSTTPPPTTTASAAVVPATTTPATTAPPTADIVDTAARTGGFVTLVRALQAAGLDATLHGAGPFTVFAPTDAAFSQLPQATFDALLRDQAKLKQILQNHVVNGALPAAQLQAGSLRTAGNGQLTVATNPSLTINGAKVVTADIAATNGVIHSIDTVLVPAGLDLPAPTVAPPTPDLVQTTIDAGTFTVFNRALVAAGLTDTLKGRGPYTVLAPTDDAFGRLAPGAIDKLLADKATLAKVLLYHVLPGKRSSASLVTGVKTVEGKSLLVNRTAGTITIDGDAKIVSPDVAATTGVIHGLDRVVFPSDVDATPYEVQAQPADAVVFFDSDSATLRADAKAVIADTAPRIKPGSTVILTGVADRRGNADANLTLSARRAEAVANALTAAGAQATFDVRAKGADPTDDLQSARRVEIDVP